MAGIDEVLERLVTDPAFRTQLSQDPATALANYMLYDDDLDVLAAAISEHAGESGSVDQRTSKSTLAGLLAAFEGVPDTTDPDRPYVVGAAHNPPQAAFELKPVFVSSYSTGGSGADVEPSTAVDVEPEIQAPDEADETGTRITGLRSASIEPSPSADEASPEISPE